MTTVIIAEKPDQARAYMDGLGIAHTAKQHKAEGKTFLDPNTIVVSARGHLLELCEPEHYGEEYKERNNLSVLPIIPSRFEYTIADDKKYIYNEIRGAINKADRVIVATDTDNEGGAIAYNILRFSGQLKYKKILRSNPTALNKAAVVRQFKNLERIDKTWRDAKAAIARSRSDWMIGMSLSRLYTTKLAEMGIVGNFAIGRSISTTLNLICQWQQQIDDFVEQPTYELTGKTTVNDQEVELRSSVRTVGQKNKRTIVQFLKDHGLTSKKMSGKVALIDSSIKESYPSVMFTKGDLYKEMARVAGWTQARSKKVMQANYDAGYQTYPRTDTAEIPLYQYEYMRDKFDEFMEIIGCKGKYEKFIMPEDKLKKYLVKPNADDAHYGIMPTEKLMDSACDVTDDQRLMYEVVVRKALTLLLNPYKYVSNRLGVLVQDVSMVAQSSSVLDRGWKNILLPNKTKKTKKPKIETQPKVGLDYSKYLKKGDTIPITLKIKVGKTTPPKPLKSIQIYDKGGLMEKAYKYVENEKYAKILKKTKGIGTSATRDEAMASLVAKKYIMVDSKDYITITANGWLINKLLEGSQINNPMLTAKWEEAYDLIDKGKAKSTGLINSTAQMVVDEINRANNEWDTKNIADYYSTKSGEFNKKVSLGKCPVCGDDVIFRKDQKNKGKWDAYSCSNKDCEFVIFRHYFDRLISEADVKKLLQGKPTHMFKNLKSKTGKAYDAQLILKPDQEKGTYKLRFYRKPSPDKRYD